MLTKLIVNINIDYCNGDKLWIKKNSTNNFGCSNRRCIRQFLCLC